MNSESVWAGTDSTTPPGREEDGEQEGIGDPELIVLSKPSLSESIVPLIVDFS
jgi:hypothetical protein